MPSELMEFKLQHLSVGNALQNFAFYSLLAFMLLVIIVQLNHDHETGVRKFVLARITRVLDALNAVCHEIFFMVRRLFISRH
jgi:hypothetical protein